MSPAPTEWLALPIGSPGPEKGPPNAERPFDLKSCKRDLATALFNPDVGSALDLRGADIDDLFAPLDKTRRGQVP